MINSVYENFQKKIFFFIILKSFINQKLFIILEDYSINKSKVSNYYTIII